MDSVAERIFELVDERFPEQKDFAAAIGETPSLVSQWRMGRTKSYQRRLPKIAEVLGTTPTYLLTGKREIYPPNLPGQFFRYKIIQLCNEAGIDPYTLMRDLSVSLAPIRRQAPYAEEFHGRVPQITEHNVEVLSEYFHVLKEDFFVDGKVPDWQALNTVPISLTQDSLAVLKAYENADERSRAIVRLALHLDIPSSPASTQNKKPD